MKKILLKKNSQGWMAFIPEFGEWLPCPFTTLAPVEMVIDKMAPLNPGYEFEVIS